MRRGIGAVGIAAFAGICAWPMLAGALSPRDVSADGMESRIDAPEHGKLVTIFDGGSKKVIKMDAETVREALEIAKIALFDGDKVEPGLDEEISDGGFFVNIYRAKPAVVTDGRISVKILTSAQEPRAVASAAGIELFPEDKVELAVSNGANLVETGVNTSFVVRRAKVVELKLYGEQMTLRTQAETVGEFLAERELGRGVDDYVSLAPDTRLVESNSLEIWRNGVSLISEEVEIPFEVQQIQDFDHDKGYLEVKEEGAAGLKKITFEVEMQDGVETSRTQISEVVTKEPVARVEVVGAKIAQGVYTTPVENERITWDFLISQGFSPEQTAGIMGNLMQEHRFKTSDAPGGLGIAQWTAGRRAKLLAMDDPTSIHTQLQFLMIELNGGYAKVKNAIMATDSIDEAMRIFQNQFERCGICREDKRLQYAHNIYTTHYTLANRNEE